jgi:hypothetical protein
MLGMDALLAGNPVMVTNGSLFLAFSSWHIFPDLIVLGRDTTHVRFGDRLFPPGGRCTAGCEVVTTEIGVVRWSLALSHLQYYGDPVIVRSNPDFSRVTFPELKLVILGYVFREWRISDRDHSLVAQWLVKLWAVIQRLPENSNTSNPPFGWLRLLVDAAEEFLNAEGRAKQKNIQLLRFGRRRGALFSVDESETLLPLFGISSPLRLMALSQNDDLSCGIYFLRRMAEDLGLHEDDSLICYATDTASKIFVVTALPHVRPSKKRNNEGLRIDEKVHTRWAISRSVSQFSSKKATNEILTVKIGNSKPDMIIHMLGGLQRLLNKEKSIILSQQLLWSLTKLGQHLHGQLLRACSLSARKHRLER